MTFSLRPKPPRSQKAERNMKQKHGGDVEKKNTTSQRVEDEELHCMFFCENKDRKNEDETFQCLSVLQ
ncbi:hypothetical protein CEXT_53221 [Caerostris extrusa]|uniref:Uncharacterized protein n=1 Tax=Caerostris extrusa TaxID=172846 RepID=A0AAV4XDH4_CAEEX|nr:hypothetical protein CEXT_53221 [Caerostris extrusa]